MALHASRLSGHIWSPRSVRPSPQGREDFSSTTQKEMCTPPQIRQAAPAGEVVQGQTSDAMVSADMTLDIETSWAAPVAQPGHSDRGFHLGGSMSKVVSALIIASFFGPVQLCPQARRGVFAVACTTLIAWWRKSLPGLVDWPLLNAVIKHGPTSGGHVEPY